MRLVEGVVMLLGMLAPAGELLILLAMVPLSVHQGLAMRDHRPWRVTREGGVLWVSHGERETQVPVAAVRRMRWAFNGNWTESKLVEDALTLFGERGRKLVKIPGSAQGLDPLRRELRQQFHEEQVDVAAPAYLD